MSDPSFNVLHRRLRTGRPVRGAAQPGSAGPPGAPDAGDALIEALPYGTLVLDAERCVEAANARLCTLLSLEPEFFIPGESFSSLARRASLRGERCLLALGALLDSSPEPGAERICSVVNAAGATIAVQSASRRDGGFVLGFARPPGYHRSDRRLAADELLDSIPDPVVRCRLEAGGALRFVFAARSAEQLFGVDHETLVAGDMDMGSFLDPDDAESLRHAVRKSAPGGARIDLMLRVCGTSGGTTWARCIGRSGHDDTGAAILDARLVNADVRIRAEIERKRLQALLDNVVENIPHIVTVRNARDLSYCLINRAAEEYTGIPRETLIGKPAGRIFGTDASDRQWERTRQLIETGQAVEMSEMEIDTAGRGHRVLRGRKFPLFDEQGEVEYVLTITEDLTGRRRRETALRRSEQRLREAIESFTDGLALYDADDRMVLCNRRYRDMWPGLAECAEPGTPYADIVGAIVRTGGLNRKIDDIDAYIAARVDHHRNPPSSTEHQLSDGRWLNVTHRATAEGGVSVTCTDITLLKEREERLRRSGLEAVHAKEAAEAASRSKSDFLANMSHELRTPLNAVIGFSEIIKDALLGEDRLDVYREYARDIHESGRHLLELINDILDMSKIEAGKLELFEETLKIGQVIDPCVKLVRDRADRSGIGIEVVVQEGLPQIRADIRKLKQILINLLGNSVKFTPSGGRVTVEAFVEPGGEFVLRVADTGTGIKPEDIERALEPFGQIDTGLARSHEGTGLGLTLTKALTEAHGGRLQIDSVRHGAPTGTTVSAILPASRVVAGGAPA